MCPCHRALKSTYNIPQYGVCYTYNFGPFYARKNITQLTYAPNVIHGLTIEMDIESKLVGTWFDIFYLRSYHDLVISTQPLLALLNMRT